MKGPASGKLLKRTKPTPGEIELLRLVGAGMQVLPAGKQLGISKGTTYDRIRRMKFLAQKDSLSGLVYWGLKSRYIEYDYAEGLQPPSPAATEIIRRLAMDESEDHICRVMRLTVDQVQGALRKARYNAGAKSRYHMVAIAWTEGWIV